MFYIDGDGFEELADLMKKLAADIDNEFYGIKQTVGNIQANVELQNYPTYQSVCEELNHITDQMNRLSQKINSINSAIDYVATSYKSEESKKIELVKKMTTYFTIVAQNVNVAVKSDQSSQLEMTENIKTTNEIQKIVTNSELEMEMINIAAISNKIQENYEVKEVTGLSAAELKMIENDALNVGISSAEAEGSREKTAE